MLQGRERGIWSSEKIQKIENKYVQVWFRLISICQVIYFRVCHMRANRNRCVRIAMLSLGYVVSHRQLSPRADVSPSRKWSGGAEPDIFNLTSLSATSEDWNPSYKFTVASYSK